MSAWEDVEYPKVGDLATHVSGTLDSRIVTKLSNASEQIYLKAGTGEIGPFDMEDYTYRREVAP